MQLEYRFWQELTTQQHADVAARYGDLAAWLSIPRARPTMILTAWEAHVLVGYSLLTHDRLSVGGAVVDVAVIRELNLSSHLLPSIAVELAMTHAAAAFEEGLGILLVRGSVSLWAPHGFAPVSYPVQTTWTLTPLVAHPEPGTVVVGVPDSEALATITDIARSRPLASVGIIDSAAPHAGTWLMLRNRFGDIRAAAHIGGSAQQWVIRRAVACDDGAASDLADALLALAPSTPPIVMLPCDHPVTRMALFSGATLQMHAAEPAGLLAGIIDLPAMLTALIPAFQSRLSGSRYQDWVGGVRLEISDERAMVMLNTGVVTVIDGTREALVRLRNIELPALAQLCFGYRSVSALRRAGLLQCDDTELALLEILFPVLQPTFGWES